MNQPLFTVIFKNMTKYVGKTNYFDTGWNQIPNKPIKTIFYRLPDGNHLVLSGYDNYFHMLEATMDLNGKNKGITKVEYAYIMGRKNGKVKSYRITLLNKKGDKYKAGDITVREFDETHERIKGLNPSNWK